MVVSLEHNEMWNVLTPSDELPGSSELEGLRALDPQAFSAVYDQYFPVIFRFARYRLGDEHQAEDITNDVFTRLLEAVRSRRGPDTNIKAWLLATTSHAVNDSLRKSYRRNVDLLDDDLADHAPQPGEIAETNERKQALHQALSRLKPDLQNVLALRFGQGFSLEETAALLNKKANHIKQLQFRALAALHLAMEEAEDEG
jgi:RNA polymerase sigma-70 factor (ECF subfamily)